MTVQEAGRMGGVKVRDTYGLDHYREIGRKGGAQTAKLGHDHFVAIGKKGRGVQKLAKAVSA